MQEDSQRLGSLTQEEAIILALEDEFRAFETYKAIAIKFQSEIPFGRIVESEARHIEALMRAARRLGVAIPPNRFAGAITPPNSLQEAYALGVEAEIENIALYDRLLPAAQDAEVRDIFYRLQAASYNHHLPAFRAHLQETPRSQDALGELWGALFPAGKEGAEKWREAGALAERFSQGKASPEELTRFLQGFNLSFLGGLLLGGAGVVVLKEWLESREENPKEKE
ncbi:ferritin-like domain-containing protein [Wolinella succinogenes]|uniref:ALR4513 PROTEIN n=1 Tax=Wolinella succinogenes (strain ATCC 29543 / DSM 1740 / CCUG 13145 / JCM 31913 / LMG 7466 / NCTC 11488 / FDC 602W) TaxID=273121 RepID=Q7M8L3_WOLSU|nr:hypothetical protein [Wolinella succinogenes]CAE10615.1 ALR4513 PROTEIN [Wolinella succinogenes]VEG80760.1 Uncharacterized conserved protein [Wolinella succinogenes]